MKVMKSYMRRQFCLIWAILIIFSVSGISYSQEKSGFNKADTLKFFTDEDLDYNLDSEEVVVPGVVDIEYGELKAKGKGLYYNNKKQLATMEGAPLIIAHYGEDIDLEMKRLSFDISARILKLSGECRLNGAQKSGSMEIVTEEMNFYTEEDIVKTPGNATVWYKKKDSETTAPKEKKPAEAGDKSDEKRTLKVDEFTMTSGALEYSFKTGDIHAAGPLKIEFEGGYFNAGEATGNLEKKIITFTGGASGSAGGISIVADKVILNYEKQEVDALGNVLVEHENGHRIKAENIHARYKEGEKSLSVKKGLSAELKMNGESSGGK